MNWTIAFAPLVPVPLVAAFAAIGLALVAFGLARRVRGSLVRALAVAALALALLNPSLLNEVRAPLTSVVALVVDRTQSQTIGERAAQTDAAREAVRARLDALENVEVREITLETGREGEAGTSLVQPLVDALGDVPPDRVAGAIVITDGQVHDAPADGAAPPIPGPVHALVTGAAGEIDRRVEIVEAPRFGLVGSIQTIRVQVATQESDIADGEIELTVSAEGRMLGRRPVPVGRPVDVTVEIAHGGDNIFEFEVPPGDDELATLNNRTVAVVEGVRENLRVLLVSGEPHAGERTWRNLLKSDAAVDLVHFTILRPPEKQDGTPINELSLIAFPTRELFSEKIEEFDLIVFDRYRRRNVLPSLYFDNIAQYVRGGGAVLVAAGPDYAGPRSIFHSPLAAALPAEPLGGVTEGPFRPEISEVGERHPVTRGLEGSETDPPSWSEWYRVVDAVPSSGETVMTGPDDKPLLVLSREGEGRVAVMLSDHVWLWARGYQGGGPHVPLLRRLAHWLMKEPELEEEALRLYAANGKLVVERQTLAETVAPVEVEFPAGETVGVELAEAAPGLWRAELDVDEIGLFRASDGTLSAFGHVGPPNPREVVDLRSTTEALAPLAEATGGSVRRLGEADAVDVPRILMRDGNRLMAGGDWIGLRQTSATELQSVERIPLIAGFLGLALLLAALGSTWWREGR